MFSSAKVGCWDSSTAVLLPTRESVIRVGVGACAVVVAALNAQCSTFTPALTQDARVESPPVDAALDAAPPDAAADASLDARDGAPEAPPPDDAGLDIAAKPDAADDADEFEDLGPPPERPDDVPPFLSGVATLAGASESGLVDGLRTDARFNNPVNLAVSPAGDVYVADFGNNAVRKVEPDGWVTTFVRQRAFEAPFGLVFAPDGTLYVETDANDRGARTNDSGTLWRVLPGRRTATVVARDLGRPRGLVLLPDGRLAMSDYVHHVISVFSFEDASVTPLAGRRDAPGYADGAGADARFDRPYGMALRADGALLVADQGNHRVRVVTLDGTVSTLAGDGLEGHIDARSASAEFNAPQGVALDATGALYVSEAEGHYVRRVAPDGDVTTVAGDGVAGYQDGELRASRFYGLEGLAMSPGGDVVYLPDGDRGTDQAYNRLRRLPLTP
jgi:sugar lactone lactonase YvrE